MKRNQRITVALAMLCSCAAGYAMAEEGSFYKRPPIFSTRPNETASLQTIARFGPVGMGINLIQPAFTMQVKNIEEGSPAAATGKLKPGQIIETINGEKLADIDPRILLGRIIADAEASDGVLKLMVKENPDANAEAVIVKIPVLGAYSETWPLNCPKSDKIVRNFADYLAKPGSSPGFSGIGMLFLLSTGEDKDLEVVRKWARGVARKTPTYAWHLGYGGIPLCEYYLRTGDKEVLPGIENWATQAARAQFYGGWAGRGGVPSVTYGGGGGHLNAGGTAVVTFLMLAKECGVDVNERVLQTVLEHFYRFAGRGNNPYGNNKPESGFVDNGKNGNLAFAMAAAASLTPDGERSVYAGARDVGALNSFYTTTFMLHGHTGGGIGEIWRSAAMGLLHDKCPNQYRQFMDNRKWHYDLSRRWDGSFGILGGARYDNTEWGAGYALAYTIPRKTLRITGAQKTPFVHEYQLPERPWGTKADDMFGSIEPAVDKNGGRQDLSQETLAHDSSMQVVGRITGSDQVSDELLRKYAHHPDHAIRQTAARKIVGINSNYLGRRSPGGEQRPALILELLGSKDSRVRHAIVEALSVGPDSALTDEAFDRAITMLADADESWWVKHAALNLISRAPADTIVANVNLLISYLQHEEWWLQNAALTALAPVVADERCYRKVLPAIGHMLATCPLWNATAPMRWGPLPENLRTASPDVQRLAAETFKDAYTGFQGVKIAPGGQDITTVYNSQVKFLAGALADVPGGYDVLYEIAKKQFPDQSLPYSDIFLGADPNRFGPELRAAIGPIIRNNLVHEYVEKNQKALLAEAECTRQRTHLRGKVDELAGLYRKIGIHAYDWHDFGGDLFGAEWDYFMFDPPEEQKYDISPWRYREVTYPAGMENWYLPDFDAEAAGWQKGQAPFGQYNGKLVTDSTPCSNPNCRCKAPMKTFWDKEVLLMRGTFEVPPLKPGHIYRLRINAGQHVGSGDGYRIYINGKQLIETKVGNGRRQGAIPRGAFITKDFIEEFAKGKVTIAATTFMRYGNKAIVQMPPVPQGIFAIWLEEMKLPPLGR